MADPILLRTMIRPPAKRYCPGSVRVLQRSRCPLTSPDPPSTLHPSVPLGAGCVDWPLVSGWVLLMTVTGGRCFPGFPAAWVQRISTGHSSYQATRPICHPLQVLKTAPSLPPAVQGWQYPQPCTVPGWLHTFVHCPFIRCSLITQFQHVTGFLSGPMCQIRDLFIRKFTSSIIYSNKNSKTVQITKQETG